MLNKAPKEVERKLQCPAVRTEGLVRVGYLFTHSAWTENLLRGKHCPVS